MKKMRVVICILLVLSITVFSGCSVKMIENGTIAADITGENGDTESDEEVYGEYPVTKYEIKDNAFEISGELKKYVYEPIDGTEDIVGILNEYYEVELKKDEATSTDDGYSNWGYDEGGVMDEKSLSVSAATGTGKFSVYYKPFNDVILSASKMGEADEEKLLDKATEFVNKFSFITGKLTFECSMPDNTLFYPMIEEGEDSSKDVRVSGRKFWFYSENYSKQTVKANDELECFVECAVDDAPLKNVQYFSVTLLADGTVISADNSVTKAKITENGVWQMITEKNTDKLLSFFKTTKKDDKLIITKIWVEAYNNYFGSVDIDPAVKVEYYFESTPDEVKTAEIVIGGLY